LADHYETLGVDKKAPADEIRRVYLQIARDRHPDRFTDPAEKAKAHQYFQEATEAFNTLTNQQRREAYDTELARPKLEKPEDLAKDAFAKAKRSAESGNDQDAVDELHIAIHHMPNEPSYHAALSRLLQRHPKHARDAVAALEKAAQLSPQNLGYQIDLANLLLAQGLSTRGKKAVEAALRIAPKDKRALALAGTVGLGQAAEPEKPKPSGGFAGLKGLFGKK
jgi:curved DNA-binding protein CbpA